MSRRPAGGSHIDDPRRPGGKDVARPGCPSAHWLTPFDETSKSTIAIFPERPLTAVQALGGFDESHVRSGPTVNGRGGSFTEARA